jgi:FkbM family methyltransferase
MANSGVHMAFDQRSRSSIRKLRPAKIRNATTRRWFESRLSRLSLVEMPGLVEFGTAYGGWIVPADVIEPSWVCYSAGMGGDISFDLELIRRCGVTVRAFDAVAGYVEDGIRQTAGEPRLSAHHAAIASTDGVVRMQVTHHPRSRSVSSARLYESHRFIELPGRALPSLMQELGDDHIDLLKLDIEGGEYELVPTLDLRGLGVRVFAAQLHHNGTVRDAHSLIARLRDQGYEPVASRPVVKLTFAARDLL